MLNKRKGLFSKSSHSGVKMDSKHIKKQQVISLDIWGGSGEGEIG